MQGWNYKQCKQHKIILYSKLSTLTYSEGCRINLVVQLKSVQSIITQHFLKNCLKHEGMVSRRVSWSGHLIKWEVFATITSNTLWKFLETVMRWTEKWYPMSSSNRQSLILVRNIKTISKCAQPTTLHWQKSRFYQAQQCCEDCPVRYTCVKFQHLRTAFTHFRGEDTGMWLELQNFTPLRFVCISQLFNCIFWLVCLAYNSSNFSRHVFTFSGVRPGAL